MRRWVASVAKAETSWTWRKLELIAQFEESTEAVLNQMCTECGKPCRNQTDMELHTKRTGHATFQDKVRAANLAHNLVPATHNTIKPGKIYVYQLAQSSLFMSNAVSTCRPARRKRWTRRGK